MHRYDSVASFDGLDGGSRARLDSQRLRSRHQALQASAERQSDLRDDQTSTYSGSRHYRQIMMAAPQPEQRSTHRLKRMLSLMYKEQLIQGTSGSTGRFPPVSSRTLHNHMQPTAERRSSEEEGSSEDAARR